MSECISLHRACDVSPTCRTLAARSSFPPVHWFPDVMSRVTEDKQAIITKNRETGNVDATRDTLMGMAEASRNLLQAGRKRRNTGFMDFAPCSFHSSPRGCPLVHQRSHGSRRLSVVLAGTECTPWSKRGTRAGFAHPSLDRHWVWQAHAASGLYDIVYIEQSDLFLLLFGTIASDDTHHCIADRYRVANLGKKVFRVRLRFIAIVLDGSNGS